MNAPPAVPTTTVAGRRPGIARAAILGIVMIGITLVRPWGDGTAPATVVDGPAHRDGDRDLALAGPVSTPTVAPSLATDQIACSPSTWQVVSLDHLGSWTVRSWMPASAVRAAGPLDPSIRTITIDSPDILALGACSPPIVDATGSAVPGGPALVVRAWRIEASAARPVALTVRREERTPGVATLYRPSGAAAGAASARASWPAGRFVLEVAPAGGSREPGSMSAGLRVDPEAQPGHAWYMGLVVRGPG